MPHEEPEPLDTSTSVIQDIMHIIAERKVRPATERSYVRSLLEGGPGKIGAKIIEEAAEVVEASTEAGEAGRAHLIHEVADLVFHTLVLIGHRDVEWAEIEAELRRRFGVSGIVEKESRGA